MFVCSGGKGTKEGFFLVRICMRGSKSFWALLSLDH